MVLGFGYRVSKGLGGLDMYWARSEVGPADLVFWVISSFRIKRYKVLRLRVFVVKSANCKDQSCNFLIPPSRANLVISEIVGGLNLSKLQTKLQRTISDKF